MTTDQTHRAVLTVTATSRPDGGNYFDQADFTAHVTEWVRAGLKGKHAVAEVTITATPAVPSAAAPPTQAAPVDRTAEVERLRTENARMRHELQVMYGGAFDSLQSAEAPQPETQAGPLPFIHTDDDGDQLAISAVMASTYDGEAPVVAVNAEQHGGDQQACVYVRPERVEQVVAALRSARQATEAMPAVVAQPGKEADRG